MKFSSIAGVALVALGFIFLSFPGQCYGALEVGFYKGKCGIWDVESLVADTVREKFSNDPTIAPALIRMQFHDCFVKVSSSILHSSLFSP